MSKAKKTPQNSGVQDVKAIIAEVKKRVQVASDGFEINSDGDKTFDSPTGTTFTIKPDGVYAKRGANDPKMVCGGLTVVAETTDVETSAKALVVEGTARDGAYITDIIPRGELVKSPRGVVERLVSMGLSVPTLGAQCGNANLIDYLNNYKITDGMRAVSVGKVGWIANAVGRAFMTPAGAIQLAEDKACYFYQGRESEEVSGTFEEWSQDVAKKAVYSSRLMFGLCVAFAPVLQTITETEIRGFHFVGPTSMGKSTILRVAQSVFGSGNNIGTWCTTDNGAEAIASRYSGRLLTLDEMKEARADIIETIIYKVMNGTGKTRANVTGDARESKKWRLFVLSSGELTAYEYAKRKGMTLDGGAEIRLVNIPACPDGGCGILDGLPEGIQQQEVSQWINALNKRVKHAQYGTAGAVFVRHLIDYIQEHGGLDAFKADINARVLEWQKNNITEELKGEEDRVAGAFSLVAVAGELAIKLGVLPWDAGRASSACKTCFDAWINEGFNSSERQAHEIKDSLIQWADSNAAGFDIFTPNNMKAPTQYADVGGNRPRLGAMAKDTGLNGTTTLVAFTTEAMHKAMRALRYQEVDVPQLLKKEGITVSNDGYYVKVGPRVKTFKGLMPVPPGYSGRYLVVINTDVLKVEA